jgi:predicted ArsR family transcriptional regulator
MFLTKQLLAGTLLGLGVQDLLAAPIVQAAEQGSGQKTKQQLDSGMTVEEVFKFAYGNSIPLMKQMAKEMGREKLIAMLTKASARNAKEMVATAAKDITERDMKAMAKFMESYTSMPPWDKAMKYEVVEKSDKVLEIKYTECPVAKIYREMKAADIGYAIECSSGDAFAKAFNPKMKAQNPKNLMKGDSACIARTELEA